MRDPELEAAWGDAAGGLSRSQPVPGDRRADGGADPRARLRPTPRCSGCPATPSRWSASSTSPRRRGGWPGWPWRWWSGGGHAYRPLVLVASDAGALLDRSPEELAAQARAALEASQQIGALRELNFARCWWRAGRWSRGAARAGGREADRCLPLPPSATRATTSSWCGQFARACRADRRLSTSFADADSTRPPCAPGGPDRLAGQLLLGLEDARRLPGRRPALALAAADQARACIARLAGQVVARDYHLFGPSPWRRWARAAAGSRARPG
jgi:hypothetical protein